MTLGLLAAGALVAGVAVLALLDRIIRDPRTTTIVLLVLASVVVIVGAPPSVTVAGFSVTLVDGVTVLILAALVARLLRRAPSGPLTGLAAVIVALAAWSLLRGIGQYGIAAAVNESRDTLVFYLGALYFATILPDPRIRRDVATAWITYATFLAALALVRWAGVLGPLPVGGHWYNPDEYGGLRVLWSDESFVLGQAFLIMLPGLLRGTLSRYQRVTAMWIFATLVLTQHRSVWAATVVGIAVLLMLEGSLGRAWGRRLVIASGIVAVLLLTLLSGPLLERTVVESDVTGTSTFEWRVEGWTSVYRDAGPESLAEVAVGRPFGAGYERRLISLGYTTDVVPHNHYISTSLRVGLLGLLALVSLYVTLIRRLRAASRTGDQRMLLSDRTLTVLLTMQMFYFIPYWPAPEQAIILGLALAAARRAAAHSLRSSAAANGTRGGTGIVAAGQPG